MHNIRVAMNAVNSVNTSLQKLVIAEPKAEIAISAVATKTLESPVKEQELVRSLNGRIKRLEDKCESLKTELSASIHECQLLKKKNAVLKRKCQSLESDIKISLETNINTTNQLVQRLDQAERHAEIARAKKSQSFLPDWCPL